MIDFTIEELNFLIDYCNKHIADCEEMTYCVSEENCKLLGVYDNLEWYENLRDKLIKLKDGEKIKDALLKAQENEEILEILKKYAKNDGWSDGWTIEFWNMKSRELNKVCKWLKENKDEVELI